MGRTSSAGSAHQRLLSVVITVQEGDLKFTGKVLEPQKIADLGFFLKTGGA